MKHQPDEFDFEPFEIDDDAEDLDKAKSKLIMDFGLQQDRPERMTLEVLKQLIRDKPERMSQAVRQWLHPEDDTLHR